jgi:putative ABC transport system permease protein
MADMNLTGGGDPERVSVARATASFQPVLGLRIARGRWFSQDEDAPERGRVVVLSDGLWRRRFGADAATVGRTVSLNDRPYIVVGVLAEGAAFPRHADAWVPIAFTAAERGPEGRGSEFLDVVARL